MSATPTPAESEACMGEAQALADNVDERRSDGAARIASTLAARDATIAGLRADLDTERARAETAERTCIAAIDSALEHTAALVRERDAALTRAATAERERDEARAALEAWEATQ